MAAREQLILLDKHSPSIFSRKGMNLEDRKKSVLYNLYLPEPVEHFLPGLWPETFGSISKVPLC
jgi:hypothetical protein